MSNSFFENLLSIKEYNDTSIIIRFCFIKIKFPKLKFIILKMKSPFYIYKRKNIDITTVPKATGQLREIQLANLAILKEADKIFKQNGITYWIDGGTMLGAVRHKGYIPWDDDIDIVMLRDDYEKVIQTISEKTANPDIYAEYYRMETNPAIIFIKVKHKKCPHLFIDIFPMDVYGKAMSVEEQNRLSEKIIELRKGLTKTINKDASNEELKNILKSISEKRIFNNAIPDEIQNCDIMWGIDFHHFQHNFFMNYNNIFPLKEIEFEGIMLPIANNYDYYLKQSFGNYMSYPDKLAIGHAAFLNLDNEEKENIKAFIESSYKEQN